MGNADLLFKYGFVDDPSNPFTTVKISDEMVRIDPDILSSLCSQIVKCYRKSVPSKQIERASRHLEPEYELAKMRSEDVRPPYKLFRALARIFAPDIDVSGTSAQKRLILDQFAKSYKSKIIDLLLYRRSLYNSCEELTVNHNILMAQRVVTEEISIISAWINHLQD